MSHTTDLTNSFILAEQPLIINKCPICGESTKETVDQQFWPLRLSIPYVIHIIATQGGRRFEKIDQRFLHIHPPQTVSQPNNIRSIPISQPALL